MKHCKILAAVLNPDRRSRQKGFRYPPPPWRVLTGGGKVGANRARRSENIKAEPTACRLSNPLGKYEIRRQLGRGAMGTVYEGFDPIIERTVAIKTVTPPRGGR